MESSEINESQSFNCKFNAAVNFLIHSPVNSLESPDDETQCQNYVKDTQYSEEPYGQVEYSISTVLKHKRRTVIMNWIVHMKVKNCCL